MIDKKYVNIATYRSKDLVGPLTSQCSLFPIEDYLISKYFLKDEMVLDLACGGGRTTVPLHDLGYSVKGVDLSDVLIQAAQKKYPPVHFQVGNYCSIEEPDESVGNILISHNGIDYAFPESERIIALEECLRVLKKNGILIFSSHNIKSLYFSYFYYKPAELRKWYLKNMKYAPKVKEYILAPTLGLDLWTYFGSPKYIIQQAQKIGFNLLEMKGFGLSDNYWFNKYISPYIHFVFMKN